MHSSRGIETMSFEIGEEDERQWRGQSVEWDHQQDENLRRETQKSWLLDNTRNMKRQDKYYVDFGCVMCTKKAFKLTMLSFLLVSLIVVLPIVIVKTLPHSKPPRFQPDEYSLALHKAIAFFDAQKSGKLAGKGKYDISWRGDSGLNDGKGSLVGGFYDGGDNTKYHFPMAFSVTMLSWSVIEYNQKYSSIGEYDHARQLIKWGADYLLKTFNSSATKIDYIYCQVGGSQNGSTTPDDETCWQKPENMNYPRPTQTCSSAPDLAAEVAAALASASIVFRDRTIFSEKLVRAAETVFAFARDFGRRRAYSVGNPRIEPYYNSTGYFDEHMWGSAWLYYATGNATYMALATNPELAKAAGAFNVVPEQSLLSWDNKLPAAMLLLTRIRMFLSPGYPYEEMLQTYHNITTLNLCSCLQRFGVFEFTRAGLIVVDHRPGRRGGSLQYVANAAFLASLFADYMDGLGVPGFYCGPDFISLNVLRTFAASQIDYILGKNPMKMSYVVGHGKKFPRRVYHRGASTPNDKKAYSCKGGFKWRDSPKPNPHNITGAMVGGPDRFDKFEDVRGRFNGTEPTIAGNAGLVAALVSLTATNGTNGVDRNTIFSAIPPFGPNSPPPPKPWKPGN